MQKRLELVFQTTGGGRLRISVPDPKDNLTAEEVQAAMNTIIAKNIFSSRTGDVDAILSARIVTSDTTELITV